MIRFFVLIVFLSALAVMAKAQVFNDRKQGRVPDSAKGAVDDYEEWLRNEPLRSEHDDSTAISPLPPSMPVVDPMKLQPVQRVSINIMTPKLRQDMRLAYQSHFLEQQRKEQIGGAMTIGINPLSLIAIVVKKLFPRRKSKKQREREKLQQLLDNY